MLVVPIVFVAIAFVDRQFVAPISFGIPTVVLIAPIVWQRELVVVEVFIDNLWVCQVDLE